MMDKLARYYPPGGSKAALDVALWLGSIVSFIVWFGFMLSAPDTWQAPLEQVVPPFRELLHPWMLHAFGYLALLCLLFVPRNYSYFRIGSKSFYIMRRVRNPWELHIRCWAVPLLGVAVVLGFAVFTYWFCCGSYFLFLEDMQLPEQQIGLFWRYVP